MNFLSFVSNTGKQREETLVALNCQALAQVCDTNVDSYFN